MTKYDVIKIILDEKSKIDHYLTKNDIIEWFWKVGFRNIEIDEISKKIICEVSRPNKFISKFRKPITNYLRYIARVFKKQGYIFKLKKFNDDEYYNMLKKYIEKVSII